MGVSDIQFHNQINRETNLERVFAGEALVAMATRKGLHSQVNALMSLEIVISVEALRTLVASEWSVVLRIGLLMMAI